MQSGISINSSIWLIAVCAAVAILFAVFLYYKDRKTAELKLPLKVLLFITRLSATFLISLLLLDIVFRNILLETQKPLILVAIDNSASMKMGKDSTKNRQFVSEFTNLIKNELDDNYEVKQVLFGSEFRTSASDPDFTDKETDISGLLDETENVYANSNVGAMILLSDGIYNRGSNPAFDTKEIAFPVYSIPFGDTTVVKDISIQKIDHNPSSYLGNVFPVSVSILSRKMRSREVTLTLSEGASVLQEKKLIIASDNELATVNFTISAEKKGIHRYSVTLRCSEKETNENNNKRSFMVEVVDQRAKILLVSESPHPDIQAIRSVIESNPSYELKLISSNAESEKADDYSLMIVHSYSSRLNGFIGNFKKRNIPVWYIKPMSSEVLNGITFSGSYVRTNDAESILNKSFGLFNVSEKLKKLSGSLPAVKTIFGNYEISNGSQALYNQKIGSVETDHPLFVFNEQMGYKTCSFLGDGLWRWKMRDFTENGNNEAFQELISKTIQYLSVKNDKSFFRVSAAMMYNEDQNIEMMAEVFNRSYEPITEPDVEMVISVKENRSYKYFFSKGDYGYRLNAGKLPPGEYNYKAKVNIGGSVQEKYGNFMVKEIVAESINTVADHGLLNRLSLQTGGKMFDQAQSKELIETIKKNEIIKPITYSTSLVSNIIDNKWIFLIIVVLLTAEWFIRKEYLNI